MTDHDGVERVITMAWRTQVTIGLDGTIFTGGGPNVGFTSGGGTGFNRDGSIRWQSGFGGDLIRPSSFSSSVVSPNGTLYGVIRGGEFSNQIVAIDPATGSVSHQVSVSTDGVTGDGFVLAVGSDGSVFCLTSDSRLLKLTPDLSAVQFSYALAPYHSANSLALGADGIIYAALAYSPDGTAKLVALGSDGTLKGEYVTLPNTQLSAPVIGPDGSLYVGTTCCYNGDVGKIYVFSR